MTVSEDSPAVALVRAYNTALHAAIAADPSDIVSALEPYLLPDAVCNETPALPWGGKWVGLEGFKGMFSAGSEVFGAIVANTGASPSSSDPATDEYVESGDVVIRRYAMVFPIADAEPTSIDCLEHYTLVDGLISVIDVYFFDVPAMVDIFSAAVAA